MNPSMRGTGGLESSFFSHADHPSTIGIGEVRGIAQAYAEFARGGARLGIDNAKLEDLKRPAPPPPGGSFDLVLRTDSHFSLGFKKPTSRFRFGSSDSAYGAVGLGGSFGFADPDLEVGFAYASNRMGLQLFDDPREKALRDAVYRCLATAPGQGPGLRSTPLGATLTHRSG